MVFDRTAFVSALPLLSKEVPAERVVDISGRTLRHDDDLDACASGFFGRLNVISKSASFSWIFLFGERST